MRTPFGIKVVQDANAYEYHLPKGLGVVAWAIFGPPSECKNTPARNIIDRKKEGLAEIDRKKKEEEPKKAGWQRVREWRESRRREIDASAPATTWQPRGQLP